MPYFHRSFFALGHTLKMLDVVQVLYFKTVGVLYSSHSSLQILLFGEGSPLALLRISHTECGFSLRTPVIERYRKLLHSQFLTSVEVSNKKPSYLRRRKTSTSLFWLLKKVSFELGGGDVQAKYLHSKAKSTGE